MKTFLKKNLMIFTLISMLWATEPFIPRPVELLPPVSLRIDSLALKQPTDLVLILPLTLVPGTTDVYRKFIPPTVARADSPDLAQRYVEALSAPDIDVIAKPHNGGMLALYKGYKVFLANCTQFIPSAADKLIALFNQHLLPPSSFLLEEHLASVIKTELLEQLEQARMQITQILFDDLKSPFKLRGQLGDGLDIFSIIKRALAVEPPSPIIYGPLECCGNFKFIGPEYVLLSEEEGICRYPEEIVLPGGKIAPTVFQTEKVKKTRHQLLERMKNLPARRLTQPDIEFIEQTVVNPYSNLNFVYYVAAKLIQDLTALEGEEFAKDFRRGEISAREKMIELLKSFFGRHIAVQILDTMFGE